MTVGSNPAAIAREIKAPIQNPVIGSSSVSNPDVSKASDIEKAIKRLSDLQKQSEDLKEHLRKLGVTGTSAWDSLSASVSKYQKQFEDSFAVTKSFSASMSKTVSAIFDDALKGAADFFGISSDLMKEFFDKSGKNKIDIFGPMATLKAAEGMKTLIGFIDSVASGIFSLQDKTMALEKVFIQAQTSYGLPFAEAAAQTYKFREGLVDIGLELKAPQEEILNIQKAFGSAFSLTDQYTNIKKISDAATELRSNTNLVSIAFAASKVTGVGSADIAELMNRAYLELGETLASVPEILGEISLSSKKSGLSFGMTADSIMSSATGLKMWGSTVSSVAPVFNMFSASLGEKSKGLTRDLTESYTAGLKSMDFSKRAMLGLQSSGGRAGDALTAGLKMEMALETGKGMKEITDNLSTTLKRFGGGQIITRDQAAQNPALERHFMVQRGILQQMMGLDVASANKTIDALKKVDEGQSAGETGGVEDELKNILESGQKAQDKNTSEMEAASRREEMAIVSAGAQISSQLKDLTQIMGIDSLVKELNALMERSIKSGGKEASSEIENIKKKIEDKLLGKEAVNAAEETTAQATRIDIDKEESKNDYMVREQKYDPIATADNKDIKKYYEQQAKNLQSQYLESVSKSNDMPGAKYKSSEETIKDSKSVSDNFIKTIEGLLQSGKENTTEDKINMIEKAFIEASQKLIPENIPIPTPSPGSTLGVANNVQSIKLPETSPVSLELPTVMGKEQPKLPTLKQITEHDNKILDNSGERINRAQYNINKTTEPLPTPQVVVNATKEEQIKQQTKTTVQEQKALLGVVPLQVIMRNDGVVDVKLKLSPEFLDDKINGGIRGIVNNGT